MYIKIYSKPPKFSFRRERERDGDKNDPNLCLFKQMYWSMMIPLVSVLVRVCQIWMWIVIGTE